MDHARASSDIERSRILFSAKTIVVITLVSIFFLSYDLYLGYPSSLFVYPPFICIFGVAMYLLSRGKFDSGRVLLLVALNFFIYIVMSSIPEDSMSAIFYVCAIVVEYVLLGNEKKIRLFAILGLSFGLYLMDAFVDFSLLPTRQYDDATLQVNKVVDFVIAVIGVLMPIKLLIDYLQAIISDRSKTNEELHRLNNELDKYAYTIIHDLKGPVYSMLRLVNLPNIQQEDFEGYLTTIRVSFRKLWGLIEEVTEQAKNRNMDVNKERFHVSEAVEVIWELLRYAPEAQGISLLLDIPKDLIVETDKRRVIGVLNNLMTNAIRYHDGAKKDQVIRVSGAVKEDCFYLTVEDNGTGIEPEHQVKVFEMFYRASTLSGGSGLGLFTVKESVEKLSGEITLESKLDEGTIFRIKIPL